MVVMHDRICFAEHPRRLSVSCHYSWALLVLMEILPAEVLYIVHMDFVQSITPLRCLGCNHAILLFVLDRFFGHNALRTRNPARTCLLIPWYSNF
jgi:hypothetical protein